MLPYVRHQFFYNLKSITLLYRFGRHYYGIAAFYHLNRFMGQKLRLPRSYSDSI